MAVFGSQEWLIKATAGDMDIPIGLSEGVVAVNVLVMN